MHKKLLSFIGLLLFVSAGTSQVSFHKTYHTANSSGAQAYCMKPTSDGGYILAGSDTTTAKGWDYYLVKTDANGDTLWSRTYGTTNDEFGQSVQQTNDGGYILTGSVNNAGDWNIFVVKTNAAGDTTWTRTITGVGDDEANSVQQTNDGGYVIVGYTNSFGNYGFFLLKTDASGTLSWAKTYQGLGNNLAYSVQQTSDGGYILAGATDGFTPSIDMLVIKTDVNGDTLWCKAYGTTGVEWGNYMQQTTDGGYLLVGYTTQNINQGDEDIYLVKTDASGDTLWTRSYGGANDEQITSFEQTADGGYIFTGSTASYGMGKGDLLLMKTNASGISSFSTIFGSGGYDWGYSVKQTGDKGYICGGFSSSYFTSFNIFLLLKTDSMGKDSCISGNILMPMITPVSTVDGSSLTVQTVTPGVSGSGASVESSCVTNTILCPQQTTAVYSIQQAVALSVYPNPSTGILNYDLRNTADKNCRIQITDIFGRMILSEQKTVSGNIDLSSYAPGTYFLRIQTANFSKTEKVLLTK
jgi:hypothetical protein